MRSCACISGETFECPNTAPTIDVPLKTKEYVNPVFPAMTCIRATAHPWLEPTTKRLGERLSQHSPRMESCLSFASPAEMEEQTLLLATSATTASPAPRYVDKKKQGTCFDKQEAAMILILHTLEHFRAQCAIQLRCPNSIDATRHEPIPTRRHRFPSQQRSKWVPMRSDSIVNTKPQIVYFGDRCVGDPFYHLTRQQGWAVKNQVVPQPVLRGSSLDSKGPKHNTTCQQMGVSTRFSASHCAEYSPRWASFDGPATTQPKPAKK